MKIHVAAMVSFFRLSHKRTAYETRCNRELEAHFVGSPRFLMDLQLGEMTL